MLLDKLISDNELDEIDMDDPFFAEAEKELEESEEFKKGILLILLIKI